ncbi:MAG: TonB-dependent receptor [Opitutus sp.]
MPFRFIFFCSFLSATSALADDNVQTLSPLVVSEAPSVADKYQLPQVTESITSLRVSETINAIDPEDAVKYFPSVFLRKRNNGDTQAVMATRVWGVSSSARSLIFADGVPLSALIANNNNIGGPRWGLVTPAEIERIDLMYGPFAAAYAGNSMGAVMEITTRQPEKLEASLQQTEALQHFCQYGTRGNFQTHQTGVSVGNRAGKFSYWISANFQDSHSQPLSYVTAPAFPVGTTGGFAAKNKLGAPAQIVGAGGLLHTQTTSARFKAAYDFLPWLRATYSFGVWRNDASSETESYLRNDAGQPTYAGLAAFATGRSEQLQQHSSHSIAVKTDTRGSWDFEAVASRYDMDRDAQRLPTTVSTTNAPSASFGSVGRVAVLKGTGWSNLDLKGTWRPAMSHRPTHTINFGAHDDRYHLLNPTYTTNDWPSNGPYTGVATEGDGKTHTQALWAQDVWQPTSTFKFTVGGRYEQWRAYEGINRNGTTVVIQPEVKAHGFSPKATAGWTIARHWVVTASIGQAYRYATPAELYQLVSTGPTFTSPDPRLKPDDVLAAELKVEYTVDQGRIRLSAFQDDVHDAIIAQFNPLLPNSTQLFSYLSNVDHVRARGVELVVEKNNVFVQGLEFTGSVTYLDARTLALTGRASATASANAAVGKRLPNIPDWRASFLLSYRPNQHWTFSAGGRYSGMLFTTLDNTDVNPNTYQGFSAWFVADVRVHYRFDGRWSAALGCDNVLNREYFLFHPFPQRTLVAELKLSF